MTPCREWQGATNGRGYGVRQSKRFTSRYVHRQIMEMVYGPEAIKGKVVMHLCDNPACFRYAHLRISTQADNLADMASKGRSNNQYRGKTHCKHGHEFTPENTYTYPDGERECKTCRRRRDINRNTITRRTH